MNLQEKIEAALPNVQPAKIKLLEKLGITTVRDFLYYFPSRYIELGAVKPISDVVAGEAVSVLAEVVKIKAVKTWRARMNMASAVLKDTTAEIEAVWFNQPYLASMLKPGSRVLISGKVSARRKNNEKYFANPSWEIVGSGEEGSEVTRPVGMLPIYSETYGISSLWLRWQIKRLFEKLADIPEILPEDILKKYKLPPLRRALIAMHFPKTLGEVEGAKKRFSFEEVFFIQLHQQRMRKKTAALPAARIKPRPDLVEAFEKTLPYQLTSAQKRAIEHILADFKRPFPMGRLLEGDVGSGKTIVAAAVSLNAVSEGSQVAFMAPTEILARQHFHEFIRRLEIYGIRIALLTSSERQKFPSKIGYKKTAELSRAQLLKELAGGDIHILIGTHSLINDKVKFKKLGLVIIDEQHRFGKEQRMMLAKEKEEQEEPQQVFGIPKNIKKNFRAAIPHLLSMTATPIPRTLALTMHGNLDLSVLDEMPAGRKKIITKIVPGSARADTYEFIRSQIVSGRQTFVICPRIQKPDEKKEYKNPRAAMMFSEMKAVKEEFKKLSEEIFPEARIAMLHGKMSSEEKAGAMKKFKEGQTDILVSTSVVEVGVDVPNATIMMIEGGERYGLSQLHQFRGRVGRGEHQSYCFVFTDSKTATALDRLKALESAKNGFELAEYDLMFRGPGELTGSRQWGLTDVGMEALKNIKMVEFARLEAETLINEDAELTRYPALRERVLAVTKKLHFE